MQSIYNLELYYRIMFMLFSQKNIHLTIISFMVYIFVNLFENLVHYNIGRFSNRETQLELPTKKDWIKIIMVMILFALLQGLLTVYFISF
jgi:hypothetical protein